MLTGAYLNTRLEGGVGTAGARIVFFSTFIQVIESHKPHLLIAFSTHKEKKNAKMDNI